MEKNLVKRRKRAKMNLKKTTGIWYPQIGSSNGNALWQTRSQRRSIRMCLRQSILVKTLASVYFHLVQLRTTLCLSKMALYRIQKESLIRESSLKLSLKLERISLLNLTTKLSKKRSGQSSSKSMEVVHPLCVISRTSTLQRSKSKLCQPLDWEVQVL